MNRFKKLCHTAKGARLLAAAILFAAMPALADVSTITVSGSWTTPEGVTSVTAEVWGGGGAGGGGNSINGGTGGGGGGFARKYGVAVVPGNSYSVSVGLGGTAASGLAGTSGGQSYFNNTSTVRATGGGGGGVNASSPGVGGTGGPGDVSFSGGNGAIGPAYEGGGGGSSAGTASNGASGSGLSGGTAPLNGGSGANAVTMAAGSPGYAPGGGGSGAYATDGMWGGNGANGQVVITYALPKPGTPAVSAFYPAQLYITWAATSTLRGYLVEASTAVNFSGTIVSTQTPLVALSTLTLSGLSANSTYYIRVGTLWNYATYYAPAIYANTMMEDPSSVYVDEVTSTTILASAYASAFTNINLGISGVAVSTDSNFEFWGSTGNYWAAKAGMPGGARQGLSAGVIGGRLYAIGGTPDGVSYLGRNEEYDPVFNVWTTKAAMPTLRKDFAIGAAGGRLYAVGGTNGGYLAVNEEYDPAANSWATKAAMPTARSNLGAAVVGGRLYAIGGKDASWQSKNEEYDPGLNAWATKAPLPAPRMYLAAGAVNGRIYAVGGAESGGQNKNEEYDPVSNSWATKAPLASPRWNLAVAAIGGKLYAVGGFDGFAAKLSTASVYDPLTNNWTFGPPLPTARMSLAAEAVGGKLYAVGGTGGPYYNINEVYDPGVSRKLTGLRPNSWYQFSAKSRNQQGLVGAQSIPWVSTFTLASVGPPWFGAPAFTNIQTSNLTVNWSSGTPSSYNNPGATYRVQVSTLPDFSVLAGNVNTGALSYQFSGLPANATHYARIQAYNSGGMTDYSWLPLGSTVTAVETPSSVYFDEVSTYSITASAYAESLSNLAWGLSGVNLTTGAAYGNWTSGGDSWTARNNILVPKHGAAAAALGGKIYVMGGTSEGLNYSADTYVYDPAANSWSTRSAMPTARYLFAAAAAGGKIYALGGYNNLAGGVLGVNQEYDPAANAWRSAAPMPTPRERLAAVSAGGKIYALGGYNSVDYSTNEIYDPANNTWITGVAMPTARKSLAAAYLNGKIYAVGGDSSGYKNVNEEYDLTSKTWSTKAAMPTARGGLAAAVIGGKLYAVSGFNGAHLNKNEAYDPGYNAWSDKKPIPVPREGMAYAATGGKLYAIGGNDGTYLSSTTAYFPGVSKEFTGLQPNTQYSLMVKARNQAGAETGSMGMFNAYTLAVATVPAGNPFLGVYGTSVTVTWSSGSQAGGYNGPNATYVVQASTSPEFRGDVYYNNVWELSRHTFEWLKSESTYYFRVQAYNANNVTDYSWAVLGSTRTGEAQDGTIISTMAVAATHRTRTMVRDSNGAIYVAYIKMHQNKKRVFISRSVNNGQSWADTTPTPIENAGDYPSANSEDQYEPALAIDSQDRLHLVWGGVNDLLDTSGGNEAKCVYSSAAVPGNSWSPYVKIPAHTYEGSEGGFNIAVDSMDGIHIVWWGQDTGGAGGWQLRYSSRSATSNSWTPYVHINDSGGIYNLYGPALAIDSGDVVHVAANRATATYTLNHPAIVYSSRSASGAWDPWTYLYTDPNSVGQAAPALVIDADGGLLAAWHSATTTNYGLSQIRYAARPAGGSWSVAAAPYSIPEAPQTDPALSADGTGRVYMVWSGSDSSHPTIGMKAGEYSGGVWNQWDNVTEGKKTQRMARARWSGWRNNAGFMDIIFDDYDGVSSTVTLRAITPSDVQMSPGWTTVPWPKPEGCGYALDVKKDGTASYTTIQAAVNALQTEFSTTTCVVLRDAETYGEQVTVQGIRTGRWEGNSYRLLIMKDPAFVSSSPVMSPPAFSEAAFKILNASVTVQGFMIMPANTVTYGILASSESVRISSVSVISGGMISAAGIQISSRSVVEYSSVAVQVAHGLRILGERSAVSFSTMTNTSTMFSALHIYNSDYNTVTRSHIYNPLGNGALLESFSDNNSISDSTMASNGDGYVALGISNNSGYNTVARSYISNQAGESAGLSMASFNAIYDSTITSNSSSLPALGLMSSQFNTLSRLHVSNPSGPAVTLASGADENTVADSTITSGAYGYAALEIWGGSTNTISGSYIQGSTGAYIVSNRATIIRGSVLVATNTAGHGLYLAANYQGGLYATTSTFSGGPSGSAIYLDANHPDKIELASNTIAGGQYGLNIASQGVTGQLQISSITFQSLSPGATAINFLNGRFNTDTEYVYFESPNIAVNVNARDLEPGSYLFMSHPYGRWGALYENDPGGYVHWPTVSASRVSPEDGAASVSPAAALRARSEGGSAAAQYHFQVDYAPEMNSQAGNPLYSFDQSSQQAYYNSGAFSGQDSTMTVAGDAFLYDSTATFVFYSTNTPLAQNSDHFWRVRVKSADSGEYGQWSSTASFTTGEPASNSPVNDIAVRSVGLSSPSVAGVNVGFTLYANNVSTGMTPNGAAYNTAEWVFVKFSTQAGADGTWNHATLSGGTVGSPDTLTLASDGKGVFIDHTVNAGNWNYASTVTWNYAADGVTGGNALVKVFAISMVKVPQGQFVYNAGGIGSSGSNNYGNGSQSNVLSATDRPTGADSGWPNGYGSFYMMRYELTQGQYADFLNTVPSTDASVLYYAIVDYGHDMPYNGANPYGSRYSATDRFAAKNNVSAADAWSFLSWAALRPMTEMEFEKAGRDVSPDARIYPWGNLDPGNSTYTPPNEGGTHVRNYANYGYVTGGLKVLDSGRYLSGDIYRTPEQTGASPYGIADLAGNAAEYVLNCSYLSVPANGNGTISWPANWPATNSDQKGRRGGDWSFGSAQYIQVSSRQGISWTDTGRAASLGVRGVRAP